MLPQDDSPCVIDASRMATEQYFNPLSVSTEGMMLYPIYYRQFGVRRAVQLVAPPLRPITTLRLPRNSVLHYAASDEAQYGIPQDDPILADERRIIMVDHIQQLRSDKGPPRPTRIPPTSMIREYHRKNRLTRKMTSYEAATRNETQLAVINYSLLPQLYRYTQTFFAGYNKWYNIESTVWQTINDRAKLNDRQHFIQMTLPTRLPTISQLMRAERNFNRTMLNLFNEPAALQILELWKWFGAGRENSLLNHIEEANLDRVNLIFSESGRWFVMNLGTVNAWRKSDGASQGIINPPQMQRRFLRLLMYLFEVRTAAQLAEEPTQSEIPAEQTPAPPKTEAEPETAPEAKPDPVRIKVDNPETGRSKTLKLEPGLNVDDLPEDNASEETAENIQLIDEAITKDLEALDRLFNEAEQTDEDEEAPVAEVEVKEKPLVSAIAEEVEYQPAERTLASGVMEKVDALADKGLLSGAEYRRFTALSTAYERLPDPYGSGKNLAEASEIRYEDLRIRKDIAMPDQKTVLDKSMLQSSLMDFDQRYIEQFLPKDIMRSVLAMQGAGVAVTGYNVEEVEDALGHYENHSVQLTPVKGKQTTVHFRVPKVDPDGTFRSNGVRYRLRKQRRDLPIRKLSSSKVALTTYYSKTFVTRSEKQVHNYTGWLTNQIAARGMDPDNKDVTNIMLANVYNSYDVVPRIYSTLAQRFRSFRLHDMDFFLDYRGRYKKYGEERVRATEKNSMVVIGNVGKDLMTVDATDTLYRVSGDTVTELGRFESLFGVTGKQPMEMVEVKILNKQIPLGIVLAYCLGLEQLLKILKVRPRRVPAGERLNLSEDEFAVRFEDESLVFSRDHRLAAMLLSGFNTFENSIRNYAVHLFDRKDIYLNLLEQNRIGLRYLREVDLMTELFVDPISKTILEQIKEPTDFIGLLIRSCELLLTDWAPAETDMAYMRNCGYERVAGAVYSELVRSIRAQRSRGSVSNAKIELPPYAVWQLIAQDPAVKLVEESNPVHNVKEKEEVTFSGVGGRSSRSMVQRTRVFHPNDMGVISEATKDSGDVAITTFMTADPNLVDLYGLTDRYDEERDGPTALLSSSALLAPCADRDDPKRVNFISIQQSSGTFAKGYQAPPLRTGYEQVIAHRTDDMFAATAKGKGKVTKVTPRAIQVTYEDGTVEAVELGRRFGKVPDAMLPHELVTQLKVGDTVEAGDCLAYNALYFSPDPLNPRIAVLKAGFLAKTAIMDSPDTLEDSSAISERAAQMLETQITKVRDIVVSFDQAVHNLVSVGDKVEVENILCTIEDAVTAQNNLFDESSLDTLRLIAANTPKAKMTGVVEKVEVFYHGDIDDLSPSLQDLALESDRNRKREARELGRRYTSGRVDSGMRVEGNPLAFEHAVIRVYITGTVPTGVGDKGVFGNQLKTIFGRVMGGVNRTESGEDLDAIFGYQSINDRIVLSPELIGTTNTLLKKISKRVVDVYKGNKP